MEKITVMFEDEPMMLISIDGVKIESTIIKENTASKISLFDLYPNRITYKNFMKWLESRLPDPTRSDIDFILKKYDVPEFMPYHMCKKSHGVKIQDFFWLKWEGEQIEYNDIRLR